ncbi:MAG: hypothetical protein FD176_65 [Rhodospirillaceae bacterium]|nr:MAG: hypothetical protein FD176_65 [Rhodospirillaceae bacterium]TNC94849.1 MAG: hypothetical protein FD119_2898 [Stygiobacter sp.]
MDGRAAKNDQNDCLALLAWVTLPPDELDKGTETMSVVHEQVRELAYRLWQEDGAPEGRAMDYWLQAEAALTAVPAKAKAAPKPKAASKSAEKTAAAAKAKTADPKAGKSPAKPKA